jgi:hypothetical protein
VSFGHVDYSTPDIRKYRGGACDAHCAIRQAQRSLRYNSVLHHCWHGKAAIWWSDLLLVIFSTDPRMQKNVSGANGSPHTIILQGQWESAILKDESTWALEDGKLVLDIRKRAEGEWKVYCCSALSFRRSFMFAFQMLIRSGINGDDSLIDPLSRVILGVAAEQSQNHALALQYYERSAQEGSWHAMRKLAALFASPHPHFSNLLCIRDQSLFSSCTRSSNHDDWLISMKIIFSL